MHLVILQVRHKKNQEKFSMSFAVDGGVVDPITKIKEVYDLEGVEILETEIVKLLNDVGADVNVMFIK